MISISGNSLYLLLIMIFSSQCFAALSENELIDQLRADYRVLQQALSELENSQNGNKKSARDEADLEDWVRQLSTQMLEDCRKLSILSVAAMPADLPCEELLSSHTEPVNIDITAEATQRQKTNQLEGQLSRSLGEFDERLLREQDRIKSRTPRTDSTAATGSASAGGGASAASGNAANESGTESQASGQEKPGSGTDANNKRTASNEKGTAGHPSSQPGSSEPEDIPDGSDDDVVARQIREAAEKESDPELQKKLWDEYRRYRDAIK